MPIRDDLILRMLDQVGEVVATVLTGRAPGSLEQAERELASAYTDLTGSGRALVSRLSSEQLLTILGAPSRFNRERGYVLARLLEADAELSSGRAGQGATEPAGTPAATSTPSGSPPAAAASAGASAAPASAPAASAPVAFSSAAARLKALDLYLEAARAGLDEDDLEGRIDALLGALSDRPLPAESHWRVFEHTTAGGRYAQAEDLLFEGLERFGAGHDVAERGRAFYRQLDGLADQALAAGALPRAEVAEGRAAFEAELKRAAGAGAE